MPWTAKQKRYFGWKAGQGDPTFKKLAHEAASEPTLPPVDSERVKKVAKIKALKSIQGA